MTPDPTRRDCGTAPSVLVVGAGPTGIMLARVSCRILERRAEESNLTRAFGVHARTLEVLDMRGIAEDLVSQGLRVPAVRPHLGRAQLRLDLNHPESRFPYVLILTQARTERLLETRARALGVELAVKGREGIRTERADYVMGCDGAHSAVRRLLGVGFVGASYDTHIMLADVRLSEGLETAINAYVGRDGVVLLPAFGDVWYRAVIWDRRREHVPLEVPVGIEELKESLRRIAQVDLKVVEMRWSTRFLSERRQAERYRVGRVFLAGDAAQIHSPLGALGMNTGIQDATNLGWKLAAEVHGWASPRLLDSYQAERQPVGREALRVTDLLQRITLAPAPVRPILARLVLGVKPLRRALRRRISGLSIAYPPPRGQRVHPWTGQRVPDASLGEARLYELMRGGHFTLLDRTDDGRVARAEEEGWADRVDIVRTSAAPPDWPALLLIRPDGSAAWSTNASAPGEQLSAGRTALSHWCGPAILDRVKSERYVLLFYDPPTTEKP